MTPIDTSAADILQTIVTAKRLEVDARRQVVPIEHLSSQCAGLKRGLSLKQALLDSPTGIIAEFKRKSPSKGYIFEGKLARSLIDGHRAVSAQVALRELEERKGVPGEVEARRGKALAAQVNLKDLARRDMRRADRHREPVREAGLEQMWS